MQHATLNRIYTGLLALLLLCGTLPALAQAAPAPQVATQADATPEVEAPSLDDLSEQLDQIRQKVTVSANEDLLSTLRQAALQVQKQADDLVAKQAVDIEHLNDQLNILGPVQPDEAQTLTSQRKTLTAQKNALVNDERQTTTLSQSARDLATQIFSLRRSLFDSQISTRTASPLSSAFWSTLIRPTDDDLRRMNGLLSDGRLRRSALALAVGLSTILTITAATSLLRWGIVSNAVLSNDVVNLLDQLQTLITFCAFIVGLGRALLMLPHPSWRLPNIADEIATAMGRFPPPGPDRCRQRPDRTGGLAGVFLRPAALPPHPPPARITPPGRLGRADPVRGCSVGRPESAGIAERLPDAGVLPGGQAAVDERGGFDGLPAGGLLRRRLRKPVITQATGRDGAGLGTGPVATPSGPGEHRAGRHRPHSAAAHRRTPGVPAIGVQPGRTARKLHPSGRYQQIPGQPEHRPERHSAGVGLPGRRPARRARAQGMNFISGLILLTERPVKVGDWVSLAGVEGDIRRINVRATEIQMSDRSTVIVPNSQFITQNVRNVTMGNALGVVGVSLTLPLETDVLKIRELLLQAFTEHEAILDTPAPS
nr:hypothetical protein [Tanacetum cinerariifolium]